jgi:hypothetical protein
MINSDMKKVYRVEILFFATIQTGWQSPVDRLFPILQHPFLEVSRNSPKFEHKVEAVER